MRTSPKTNRRQFLSHTMATGLGLAAAPHVAAAAPSRPLFDGRTLQGWRAIPRLAVPKEPRFASLPPEELKAAVTQWYAAKNPEKVAHIGRWEVVDGAIVGGHQPEDSLFGAYLISEQKFGDFELELEAHPDWPADTGIMIRAHELGSMGFQVLADYRPHGCVGGVYGNAIGGFLATPFTFTGDSLPGMRVGNLRAAPMESNAVPVKPDYCAGLEDFLKAWKVNDWNRLRIRCTGRLPVITTWVNDIKICELDTAKIQAPGYDAETVARQLGRAGHLAFEVHDVSLKNPLGRDRWGVGAKCRWRSISITEL